MNKIGFSGKCLGFILLILIGVFLILTFFGVFSISSLAIVVKQSASVRKPLALLFIGCVLLAFIIICIITRHQKR
jgi:hypothetical protein